MIIRTILFFLLMYFLVKFISRLFLPSSSRHTNNNAGFFYRNFGQYYEEGKRQSEERHNNSPERFNEIEEAEYEDITEKSNSSSKSSD